MAEPRGAAPVLHGGAGRLGHSQEQQHACDPAGVPGEQQRSSAIQ